MPPETVRVLFENPDYLAVDKPEGVVSLAEAGKGGLPEVLRDVFPGKLFPVHRLDRGASGVIVFAKNPEAHRHLNGEFDRRAPLASRGSAWQCDLRTAANVEIIRPAPWSVGGALARVRRGAAARLCHDLPADVAPLAVAFLVGDRVGLFGG